MQILNRHLAIPLHRAMQQSAAVLLSGPRGSGKTTLAQREFPGHRYINFADTADRLRARQDPAGFLGGLRGGAILDEIHRAPELRLALEHHRTGQWLLLSPVRLEWAGVPELHLFPPSLAECVGRPLPALEARARYAPPALDPPAGPLEHWLGAGATNSSDREFADDIRTLIGLHDADRFHAFVGLVAGASGQVADQSAWARACGVTHTTIGRWLTALERSFRVVALAPYAESFGQRLVRRRKVYFLEVALVPEPQRFASWGVAEVIKNLAHSGELPRLSHWLTATGRETGLVAECAGGPVSVSFTRLPVASPALLESAWKWRRLDGRHAAVVLTGGAAARECRGVFSLPWFGL